MHKPTLIAVCLCLYAPFAMAQHPLDDFPFSVGGYVHSASGNAIENASVTFIDPITLEEFSGLTDATGWYGNLGYVGVSDVPQAGYLRGNYPNPFLHATTIEIHSDGLKSNGSRSLEIFDIRGRLVGTIPVASGSHEIQTISKGSLPHGAYFYRLAGEVRKMIGSPRNVTVRLIGSEEKTVSSVEHQVIVSADGFEQVDMLVELIEGEINHLDFSLTAIQTPLDFTLRAFRVDGSEVLSDGVVSVRRGDFEQSSVGVDGYYYFSVPAGLDSLELFVDGFAGYDRNVFSVLRSDRVAARGFLGDDLFGVPVDSLQVDGVMNAYLVPDSRLDDDSWKMSVGVGWPGVFRRVDDPRVVLYTNTYESDFTVPAQPHALDWLRDGLNRVYAVFAGGSLDGLPLIGYTHEETSEPADWGWPHPMQGRWDVYVRNNSVPGNVRWDFDGDGAIDYANAQIRDNSGTGITMDELLGGITLFDNPDVISGAYLSDGTITPWGVDAIHTVMKSRLGRNYNYID